MTGFKIAGWSAFGPGHAVFAQKEYVRSFNTVCGLPVIENTTLKVVHNPLP